MVPTSAASSGRTSAAGIQVQIRSAAALRVGATTTVDHEMTLTAPTIEATNDERSSLDRRHPVGAAVTETWCGLGVIRTLLARCVQPHAALERCGVPVALLGPTDTGRVDVSLLVCR
jgi:hypothetical protein